LDVVGAQDLGCRRRNDNDNVLRANCSWTNGFAEEEGSDGLVWRRRIIWSWGSGRACWRKRQWRRCVRAWSTLWSWRAWHSAPQSPYPLTQLGLGMIRSSLGFTRLRTSVSSAERLSHFGGDQLGIAFVAIWPLCKWLRAQKTWNLKFPYSRICAKHVEVAASSSSCRSTAFVQPSFCVGYATQKLLIRFVLRTGTW